jgi:V8-like Glu-specific endopeptidase
MGSTFSNRLIAIVAGIAVAAVAPTLASRPGAVTSGSAAGAGVIQDAVGAAARAAAVRYWTSARMSGALLATDGSAAAGRAQRAAAGPPAGAARPVTVVRLQRGTRLLARQRPPALRDTALRDTAAMDTAARDLVRKPPPGTQPAWLRGDTAGAGLRWARGGTVAAVGRVFFTLGGADYVCSGALVGGARPDVVLTAAHCVTGGPGRGRATQWAANWVFVPGFTDGRMPYGEYTGRRFLVSPGWTAPGGGESDDFAFVQVTAATPHGGSGVARPPRGLPVKFAGSQDAAALTRAYLFGYPAGSPYAGLYLTYCAGQVTASGSSVRMPCGMTAGDSGGPWLAGFRPRTGSGQVTAVITYKMSGDLAVLYGTVLGPRARALYQRAVRLAR